MPGLLDSITKENDIKNIEPQQYKQLADEIRHFLVSRVSRTGGHLASNLGVVELTMALHKYMTFPEDKLIWDVGHQAYTHKLLTGRKEEFKTLRQYGGMSGFPKRRESECDAFDTGHSSTSISAALGMAAARDLEGKNNKIIAVIGDGALSGGMAYEALNNAARLRSNLIIILNDNNMSISENVGGMANYLGKIRTNSRYQGLKDDVETALRKVPGLGNKIVDKIRRSKDSIKRLVIPGMLFEDMGLTYIGPIDGHNMDQLNTALKSAGKMKEAVIIHVITKKGKGYKKAEKHPSDFHGVDPFFASSGAPRVEKRANGYTDVFGKKLVELAKEDDKIVAITAAMPSGTGLTEFRGKYPNRFFDVGIAEEHGVTFAAGLASEGCKPVVAVYSTFLQRAYDQILHDVCINRLPVVFAVDRAGLVGSDGETHQGVFDLSYLGSIPNLVVMAPKNSRELEAMLAYALSLEEPAAIRYPRGEAYEGLEEFNTPVVKGKSEILYQESRVALLAVGSMVKTGIETRELLKEKGYPVTLVNVRFVRPFDEEMLINICSDHDIIVTMEENVSNGGFGQMVSSCLVKFGIKNVRMIPVAVPDAFIEHGNVDQLKEITGLTPEKIAERIITVR